MHGRYDDETITVIALNHGSVVNPRSPRPYFMFSCIAADDAGRNRWPDLDRACIHLKPGETPPVAEGGTMYRLNGYFEGERCFEFDTIRPTEHRQNAAGPTIATRQ